MNIEWINKEKETSAVTIYNNNITFSKQASTLFENAYGIAIGYDLEGNNIVMKKVTKDEIMNKSVDKDDVYILTMKPSFGRINSKKLINELNKYIKLDFNSKMAYKFSAKWNNALKMLIVNTEEVARND